MNIAIIGTGGVGGYFGGRLAQAGNNVTFIARGEHLKAILKDGLTVKSIKGDFTIQPANATSNIGEIESPDMVILGIKAWQIKETAADLKNLINENTTVLPLQNGVLSSEELRDELGLRPVVAGLCRIFSKIEAPGIINHYGIEPTIVFGELDNKVTPRIQRMKEAFQKAGIESIISADIHTELWKKLMIIGSGGLLAISHSTYGGVRENPETRQLMQSLLTEIYEVSQKAGAKIEYSFVEKTLEYIDSYPYDSTTSLARDIWAGKPSELDYQTGTIVHLGEKYGVNTPVNKFIYYCLLPLERKARANK